MKRRRRALLTRRERAHIRRACRRIDVCRLSAREVDRRVGRVVDAMEGR